MKSKRKQRQEAQAGLTHLNAIIARVVPADIEDRMRDWEAFCNHASDECDECRRVASADQKQDWLYSMALAPILDPQKVGALEGPDKSFFVKVGSGVLWRLRQRCEACAAERPLEGADA